MLPLYDKHTYNTIGTTTNAQSCPGKIQTINGSDCKTSEGGFSFFKDVISNIAPALKNLN
jgi:hypothetical protein